MLFVFVLKMKSMMRHPMRVVKIRDTIKGKEKKGVRLGVMLFVLDTVSSKVVVHQLPN